jgi:hypothetical protein
MMTPSPHTVTFDSFTIATTETPAQPTSAASPAPATDPLGALVALQFKRAKILPASVLNPITLTADIIQFVSDQIIEAHRGILNDGSATMKDRRLSYQSLNLHFLILLALAGRVAYAEPTQPQE